MAIDLNVFFETNIGGTSLTYGELTWFLIVLLVAIAIAKLITMRLKKRIADRIPKNDIGVLLKLIYFGIIFIGILVALPEGYDPSGLLLAGGIASVVIAFASQSVVSNFISGLFLIVERPIKIGDNVGIGDVTGVVEDVRIISTIIRTFDGVYVRMPNEQVFTTNITNFVANAARRFNYVIGIRYSDDADKAIAIIKDVLWEHPYVLKSPGPSVFVDNLGDNSVNITVNIWTPSRVWWEVRTEMLWKLKTSLEEHGIEVPFPQRTVWFPEGIRAKIDQPKGPSFDQHHH
jgi:small-conductance mechanosensitive channel